MRMTDRELVEAILSDALRREAVEQLVQMLLSTERTGRINCRYEVTANGRQVSSAVYQHHCTKTLSERVQATP
jgi:hypothetical protein